MREQVMLRMLSCIQIASKMFSSVKFHLCPHWTRTLVESARIRRTLYRESSALESSIRRFYLSVMQRHESSGSLGSGTCSVSLPRMETSRPAAPAWKPLPKVKWSRRRGKKSKVYLVPYQPSLSPIFEESQGSSQDGAVPCSQPLLLRPFARYSTYGVITPRLNRVVIAIEEDSSKFSTWTERVAKILALSWFLMLLSVLVLMVGVLMIWMAFSGEANGDGAMTHRNVVTVFVGIAVIAMAVLFVLWNASRGLR
ncbi:uncharacterized protein [Dermacentor albipictus]